MVLHDLAHVRTGDKGDTSQIAVFAHAEASYEILARTVTCERLRNHLQADERVAITRYELPQLGALNFVLVGMLRGGVTRSLALDPHGKTLGLQLLNMVLDE